MNWQKAGAILSVLIPLMGATWWFSQNVVLAEDFDQFRDEQSVRWLQSDRRDAWQEYVGLRQLPDLNERDKARIMELEEDIKEIDSEIQAVREHHQ